MKPKSPEAHLKIIGRSIQEDGSVGWHAGCSTFCQAPPSFPCSEEMWAMNVVLNGITRRLTTIKDTPLSPFRVQRAHAPGRNPSVTPRSTDRNVKARLGHFVPMQWLSRTSLLASLGFLVLFRRGLFLLGETPSIAHLAKCFALLLCELS